VNIIQNQSIWNHKHREDHGNISLEKTKHPITVECKGGGSRRFRSSLRFSCFIELTVFDITNVEVLITLIPSATSG
jgi:hypothetical protein